MGIFGISLVQEIEKSYFFSNLKHAKIHNFQALPKAKLSYKLQFLSCRKWHSIFWKLRTWQLWHIIRFFHFYVRFLREWGGPSYSRHPVKQLDDRPSTSAKLVNSNGSFTQLLISNKYIYSHKFLSWLDVMNCTVRWPIRPCTKHFREISIISLINERISFKLRLSRAWL